MTEEQIREWISDYLKKNPQVAEEYKKEHLANLQSDLKLTQLEFDRNKYESNAKRIVDLTKEIHENENKSAAEVFTENYIKQYIPREKELKENISLYKGFDEEDAYIYAVFIEVGYIGIKTKEDLDYYLTSKNYTNYKSYRHKINAIYKKGLSKRDEYVKKGQKIIDDRVASNQLELDNLQQELIQNLTDSEVNSKKQNCRELSQISVADAFKQLGTELTERQSEKIERIIEMHDPKVVESAIKRLSENPTKNFQELNKYVAKHKPEMYKDSASPILSFTVGAAFGVGAIVLAAVGLVTNAPMLAAIGGGGILGLGAAIMSGAGVTGVLFNKQVDKKDSLVYRCIDDLLTEVVKEETANVGKENVR